MAATYAGALAERRFRRLLLAHAAATVGQLAVVGAVGLEVLQRTGSGVWLSVVGASSLLPYVLCSGLAGAAADRWSRSTVVVVSAGARGALAALTAAGLAVHAPVAALAAAAAVISVLGTPGYPATAAATLETVADDQLPAANALVTATENAAWVAGPGVLGLLLLAGAPLSTAAAVAAVLLGAAALVAGGVRLPPPTWSTSAEGLGDDPAAWSTFAGVRLVVRDGRVRAPMLVAVADNLLYGYVTVAVVLLAYDALHAGTEGVGWLTAGLTAGAVASFVVVNRLVGRGRGWRVLAVPLLGTAVGTGLLGLAPNVPVAVGLLVGVGLLCLVAEVAAVTTLQRAAPAAVTARVFGVYDTLNVGAIAVGAAVAGPLAEALGPRGATVAAGLAVAIVQVALLPQLRRHVPEPALAGRHARRGASRPAIPAPREPERADVLG